MIRYRDGKRPVIPEFDSQMRIAVLEYALKLAVQASLDDRWIPASISVQSELEKFIEQAEQEVSNAD